MALVVDRVLNIVLVENDELGVMNLRRALEKAHITQPLWVAENGIEALRLLRGTEVPRARRLVVLNLHMPRMSGLELLRALRSDAELATTPVVVLTSSNEERDRVEAYQLHVAGYLLKPVTRDAFVELVSALNSYWTQVEL